ncbi:mechanosensitive ion channel family protein [Chakrabartyella piscis]|uniref:mechanosensitive ion channel family protein n=1 Tax=Chakrabartyella piscis TaxID=2918914 RepID=UPI002958BB96|nr:mechanosensitive ion channel family protein [Chakrabartyella piscis]
MEGIDMIVLEKTLESAMSLGIKVLQIILTLVVCFALIRFSQKALRKFFIGQTQKERLAFSERKAQTLNSISSSVLKYVIYFIGILSVLRQLGVSDSSLVVVASAGSVAVGLGAQSVVGDMLEGFFILFEDYYAVGDIVTIQGITGVVEGVALRSTKIRDVDGRLHIIPNGSVGTVTNMCNEYMNAVLVIGVAYKENIDHVLVVLQDEMTKTSDIEGIMEAPIVVGVVALNESSVDVKIVAKCQVKTNLGVEAELRRRVKNRFDKENIEIPFPQRTIHMVQSKTNY